MTDNAAPFFIGPHRFDDADGDGRSSPRLDRRHDVVPDPGEHVLWRGRLGLAGYLLGPGPHDGRLHWSLPAPVPVTVTDRRIAYVCPDWGRPSLAVGAPRAVQRQRMGRVASGQIRWQWPSRLHVLPGAAPEGVSADGPGGPDHLLIVCTSLRTVREPALALFGGDGPLNDLLRLIRRAVASYRLANPGMVDLCPPERDVLRARARLVCSVEESRAGQRGFSLPGALPVEFLHRDDHYRRMLTGGRHRQADADPVHGHQPGSAC